MSLYEKLEQDMKEALRNREEIRLSTIRFLRSQIKNRQIHKKSPLTDEEIIETVQREINQRREIFPALERASRQDLIKQTNEEIVILEGYLPAQLSQEELKQIIDEVIKEVGAAGPRDMGKVMGILMPRVKGKTDGKVVSELVKVRLNECNN
ncbi:aspartyl-tRNA amidotransferase [Candidatus Desantisbacteria bacterium CG1_02_38_46]|uniref:Aspartyl-tRNA amidotransferase n=1 Tax=Candidatus Desantisbacteria bacterium CG1_02_38_46 TaxID=1817893 RepID=A0A1J4SEM8_9BACT|nr:MAG: aspartyl-tRNA amidotransferase [Candidatus Desantisbacteria bacterium CG1_02_38_46]